MYISHNHTNKNNKPILQECDVCGEILTKSGAAMYSPPDLDSGNIEMLIACRNCWGTIINSLHNDDDKIKTKLLFDILKENSNAEAGDVVTFTGYSEIVRFLTKFANLTIFSAATKLGLQNIHKAIGKINVFDSSNISLLMATGKDNEAIRFEITITNEDTLNNSVVFISHLFNDNILI